MLADPPTDTKPFTLMRLLTVIAVVAALSAFAPWQAAPAMPPAVFLPPPPDAQVWQAFRQQHSESSKQIISEQPRHHFVPAVGIKP